MTALDKPVARVTRGTYCVLQGGRRYARAIVVELAPGDVLRFREKGRRTWYAIPIDTTFGIAVKASAGFRLHMLPDRKRKARRHE